MSEVPSLRNGRFQAGRSDAKITARSETTMSDADQLNPLARKVWTALNSAYPGWAEFFGTRGEGDLEVAVPAPPGSKAGHLVVSTNRGEDLWVRFSPPSMAYAVDSETELLSVVDLLLTEAVLFVTVFQDNHCIETTLIRTTEPGDIPHLKPDEVANVVSWTGRYDQTIGPNV
jgi:hypothetical protein